MFTARIQMSRYCVRIGYVSSCAFLPVLSSQTHYIKKYTKVFTLILVITQMRKECLTTQTAPFLEKYSLFYLYRHPLLTPSDKKLVLSSTIHYIKKYTKVFSLILVITQMRKKCLTSQTAPSFEKHSLLYLYRHPLLTPADKKLDLSSTMHYIKKYTKVF